jgi:hypothetical protein
MRIADGKDDIRVGKSTALDDAALTEIRSVITEIGALNRDIWSVISDLGYPV